MNWWPYLQGFTVIHLDGFATFPGDLWLVALATWKETNGFVLQQRRDKRTLLWVVSIQILLALTQSCLSSRSFPTPPAHSGDRQTPCWSVGPSSVLTISPLPWSTVRYDFMWKGFISSKTLWDPWRQEVRALSPQQVKIMDSGLG